MADRPIERQWRSFLERVLPAQAGEVQRREMKRAFYAGAQALYGTLMGGLTPGDDVHEPDLQMMANIHDDLERFGQDVSAGRE